ncbi:MAG TPA: DNA mismatch repair protein MutS [Gemmatimonadaceae bacterium]|nr:DNA mismatch repair protein MutS [Gemmatimonadaceae bacterium]
MSRSDTQMMQQWRELKHQHQHAILLYRCGDFYEMFYEDAEVGSRVLGLTLTARNNGGAADVPLAGVPVKAVGEYVRRLVQQGFRVAICEQVEDPRLAKGIVRREVVETVTPGAVFADDLLDTGRNNYLCAVHAAGDAPGAMAGVAAADVSTGELRLFVVPRAALDPVLARLSPREVLVAAGSDALATADGDGEGRSTALDGVLVTEREAWEFDPALGGDDLARQFGVHSLEGFGLGAVDAPAVGAAGALLRYLHELLPTGVPHLARPTVERPGGVMPLDEMTRRNLELVESLRGGERAGTLLDVLDRTMTPMGARLLRQWILAPLTAPAAIEARLDAVSALASEPIARAALREALDGVRDLERLAGKAAAGRATPRELGALGQSLARLPAVEQAARRLGGAGLLADVMARWDRCAELTDEIARTLVDRPPVAIGDDDTVRPGVDPTLDDLRALRDGGKDGIARIQAAERSRTGIQSLKVGYNKVFGYYLEVTNANAHLVPADYQRRQTLTGAERYVTPALKEYEERVLTASERIDGREMELFVALRGRVGAAVARLQCVARCAAELDVLASLAEVAEREGYVRPAVTEEFALEVERGRHPVVERMMARDKFIPNDVRLTEDARLIILTGPNMAGKSTILRQVGLIVLMAQMGSFVPAARARVGVADRVFTRVGASDNLVRGQSTFMVEMSETSAILHTATSRSLVLLDEIGRGTSTYDGVSIAWAVSEHLHDAVGCKCVFATHYHELTQLGDELGAARNYNVAVREVGDKVLFLHRLQPGGADRSYGIEVGRLAGLPEGVLARAREVLRLLEGEQLVERLGKGATPGSGERAARGAPRRVRGARPAAAAGQLPLFEAPAPHPVVERVRGLEVERMTPVEAIVELAKLKGMLGGEGG